MGEVYRARDPRLDRHVALKVLPQAVVSGAERLARFEREARILAALNHSHIAQVFGVEEVSRDGSAATAIVMELVEGEDLSAIIGRGPVAVPDALTIARQIADALECAHEQGIIHRDLKPGNVKVRADGTVKLLDFGLAKAVETATTSATAANSPTITTPAMTHAGVVLGTAAYMSPEQAKGKPLDRRADIWAFGVVLYEMLTGARAFPGEDVTDAIVSIMRSEPDWAKLPSDTPPRVRGLLKRTLEKDARRRLRDIGEARLVLDDAISGHADDDRAAPLADQRPPWWRRALPLAATAILTAIVAFAVGYAAWQSRGDESAGAVRFFYPVPEDVLFTRSSSRILDISRDGSQIVYVGNRQLNVRSLASAEFRPIPGTVGLDPAGPMISPDGKWVAFYSVPDGAIKKAAISGGAPVTLCTVGAGVAIFQPGTWSGDHIYFASNGKGILRVSADGGEPEIVVPVDASRFVYGPEVLPGGQALLMSVAADVSTDRWDRAEIVAYSPATGERKTIIKGGGAPRYLHSGHLLYAIGNNILAVLFDAKRLEVRGGPVPVIENVRRVLDSVSGAAQFVVSEAGHIAFVSGAAGDARQSQLALVDRAGGKPQVLSVPPRRYTGPTVSPDGKQFVVTVTDENGASIWIGALAPQTLLSRLTFGIRDRSPIWSRDSRFVFYASDTGGGATAILRQAADRSGQPERLVERASSLAPESAHPDGRITFSVAGAADVWILAPGSEPKPLVTGPGFQRYSSFSPDGRWLAYTTRDESGKSDIYVEPFPASGSKYQLSTDGGSGSVWSPSGSEIFYTEQPGDLTTAGKLMSMSIRITPTFSPGPSVEVKVTGGTISTNSPNFDVTPDGKSLLVAVPVTGVAVRPAERINVILNWRDELRALVPPQ